MNDDRRTIGKDRQSAPQAPIPEVSPGPGLRIVLIDDSAMIRERLYWSLASIEGVEIVGSVADAAAALRAIDSLEPDLLVLDVNLGRRDGWQVLQHALRHRSAPTVMVFSNDDAPTTRERYLLGGASGFFDKSLEFDALRDAICARAREHGRALSARSRPL